jgi:integrase
VPLIGSLPLNAITRERVRQCLTELATTGNRLTPRKRPLARETLKVTLSLLHSVLARAVEDGLIARNPATGLAREIRSTPAAEATEVEVFTREELGRLLSAAEQDWPDGTRSFLPWRVGDFGLARGLVWSGETWTSISASSLCGGL